MDCKFCNERIPLKRYLDGTLRHFDGLMAWHRCLNQGNLLADGSLSAAFVAKQNRHAKALGQLGGKVKSERKRLATTESLKKARAAKAAKSPAPPFVRRGK